VLVAPETVIVPSVAAAPLIVPVIVLPVPENVTEAPRLVVPDTLNKVTLLIAPPIEEFPVSVKEKPPPSTVDEVVIVVPVSVVLPVNVTAPVYVCVEDVVTLAPILEAPETSNVVPLEIAAVVVNAVVLTASLNVVAPLTVNCAGLYVFPILLAIVLVAPETLIVPFPAAEPSIVPVIVLLDPEN